MEIRLLGPVEVWGADGPIDVGGPRPRTVLAALAAEPGRALSTDALIDRVWDDDPPARARHTLHAYITRLRRALRGPEVTLSHRNGAYTLHIAAAAVDTARARDLIDRAREPELEAGSRSRLLRQAAGLWRGEPLAGLPGGWAGTVREQWTALRLDVAVQRARAELDRGAAGAAVRLLEPLAGEFPLAETLTETLMSALATAGRHAEALERYARLRRRLADELGCDPRPGLRELHERILRGEPAEPAGRPVPAQLPPDVPGFAGRGEQVARLDALLPAIVALSGTAGVGKTALAVHWAHRVAGRFPDGRLYVNLRGFDQPDAIVTAAEAVRGFLDALGVSPERIPQHFDAQVALYRSLLAGKRVLVVLDNARDAAHTRPLLPAGPAAMAVVTSRDQLTGLVTAEGAHPLILDPLTAAEARQLLERRLGADRIAREPAAVGRIVAACAGLPLALSLVAARAQQTRFPLETLAGEPQRLVGLDTGDRATQLATVFSWSYATLSRPAARLFRLLGLHPGAEVSVAAAASLAGQPVREVRAPLAELVRGHLVDEYLPERFAMHDLLRAYAADLASGSEPARARTRLLGHYMQVAHLPSAGHTAAWQLSCLTADHIYADGNVEDALRTYEKALIAAEETGDALEQRALCHAIAKLNVRVGRVAEVDRYAARETALCLRSGDEVGVADVHQLTTSVLAMRGRPADALRSAERMLALYRRNGEVLGEAIGRNAVGWFAGQLGDLPRAIRECRRALDLHDGPAAGDSRSKTSTLDSLGYAHSKLGRHDEAIDFYLRALTAGERGASSPVLRVEVLQSLGDAYLAAGDRHRARRAYADTLDALVGPLIPQYADGLRDRLRAL